MRETKQKQISFVKNKKWKHGIDCCNLNTL